MQMRFRRTFTIVLGSAALCLPLAAGAQVSVNINVPGLITIAPPAPRIEPMPSPRGDQVWVPGHWEWGRDAYAWRGGYWVAARPDYDYVPGHWEQVKGGWRWVDGDWRSGKKGGNHCPPGQAKKGRC